MFDITRAYDACGYERKPWHPDPKDEETPKYEFVIGFDPYPIPMCVCILVGGFSPYPSEK